MSNRDQQLTGHTDLRGTGQDLSQLMSLTLPAVWLFLIESVYSVYDFIKQVWALSLNGGKARSTNL